MTENPKHYAGALKLPHCDMPTMVRFEVELAMHEGARKYGAFNYRQTPILASDYHSAAQRHIAQWWELHEDPDPTCGISHLSKAIACLTVLRDAEMNGMLKDDRPPSVSKQIWERLEKVAAELRLKYPEPKERVTQWGDKVPEATHPSPPVRRGTYTPVSVETGEYFDPPVAGYTR